MPLLRASLPHPQASQALQTVLKASPAVFTWPVLPLRNRRERNDVLSALGLPGLTFDDQTGRVVVQQSAIAPRLDRLALAYLRNEVNQGALPPEAMGGWAETFRTASVAFRGQLLVVEMYGPVSLALQLTDEMQHPIAYDAPLLEALVQHLALRMGWLVAQLANLAPELLVCLEEPFLSAPGTPFCPLALEQSDELLQRVYATTGARLGLLPGDDANWKRALTARVDVVYMNANDEGALLVHHETLAELLKRNGAVVWGIVPTDAELLGRASADRLVERMGHMAAQLSDDGLSAEAVFRRAFVSTSGGLSHLPVAAAEQAIWLCNEVSSRLRAEHKIG
jgi:hypothetical protein